MKPLLLLIAGIVMLAGTPALPVDGRAWRIPWLTVPAIISPSTATAAVYVYEKDDGPIPVGVLSGINRLNRERKITASLFEDDVTDGAGEVPEQYRPALSAAKAASIPALVVLAGTAAVKVVRSPTTEEQVMRAVP